MKKIININLSGRVIPIEDSAYEKLQAYIESLRRYFAKEESRDEIINDIESRIAELLHEKIRKGASVIKDLDIEEIATSMGRPEDFEAEEVLEASAGPKQQSQQEQEYTYTEKKTSKGRLYRDSSDKFIGGVCSGIAAYMNVDPAIVRILFAIITFGGFGLGFLVYILLWIILPPKDMEGYLGKRLYRNPDDKVISGVAGGLAAYFDKSVTTVRLIFAAPLILSILLSIISDYRWNHDFDLFPNLVFGSLSGTFILAYIVLWIVLPVAHSTYEKMEMRGEKVDVNRIRQNVKEGADNMKERMKTWSDEVKESAQNFSTKAQEFANTRGKTFASEINETARRSGGGIAHAIGVLFKVFFLFIAGTIAFALFVTVIALIFGGVAWWPVNNFLWTSKWQQFYAWGTLIFFLGVPLIGSILWVIRRMMRTRSKSNYLGWTFGFLWTIGWVVAILLATSIARDFREYEHQDEVVSVTQPSNGKMVLAVSQPELEYSGRFGWMNDGGTGWDLNSDTMKLSSVDIKVIVSPDSFYHVTLKRYSFGYSEQDALDRAEKIRYSVISRDTLLDLASGYGFDSESKFRGQQVEVEIQVPIGRKIRFDESIIDKLNPTNFRVRRSTRTDRVNNRVQYRNTSYSFNFKVNTDYTMGINGVLKDDEGNTIKDSKYYRYEPAVDSNNAEDINRQLENERIKREEAERMKEESDRRIRELENQQKEIQKPVSGGEESMDEADVLPSRKSSSAIYALTEWF